MKLTIAIAALAIAVGFSATANGANNDSAKIANLEAKFNCMAHHSKPMYEHIKTVYVPLSHLQATTDLAGDPTTESYPDLQFNVHNYTQHRGGTGFLTGYVVDKGCFLLPMAP